MRCAACLPSLIRMGAAQTQLRRAVRPRTTLPTLICMHQQALRETGMQSRATLCSAQSQRGVGLAMETRAAKRHPPDLELHASHGAASSAARPHATLPTLIRMYRRGMSQCGGGHAVGRNPSDRAARLRAFFSTVKVVFGPNKGSSRP